MRGNVALLAATGRSHLSMKYSVSLGIPALIAHPCDTCIRSMKE